MSDPVTIGFLAFGASAIQNLFKWASGHQRDHEEEPYDDNEPEIDSVNSGGDQDPPSEPPKSPEHILASPMERPSTNGTTNGSTNGARYRPQTFEDFIGNEVAKKRLRFAIEAAKKEQRLPGHMLLYGNAGTGKTSLANIVAREIGAQARTITGGVLANELDLFSMLFELYDQQRQNHEVILLIDEIHAIAKSGGLPLEVWLPILEDGKFFHSLKGKTFEHTQCSELNGFHAHQITTDLLELNPFTVIGMTTDPADLNDPVMDRFTFSVKLEAYTVEELTEILQLHARHRFDLTIDELVARALASRARSNPRRGINLLKECYDRSVVESQPLSVKLIEAHMQLLGIEADGITQDDLQYLRALAKHEKGLSIGGLASVIQIKRQTIEQMMEPFLKQRGLIVVTNRRHLSADGKAYLKQRTG